MRSVDESVSLSGGEDRDGARELASASRGSMPRECVSTRATNEGADAPGENELSVGTSSTSR
jgi:hypothetical protein